MNSNLETEFMDIFEKFQPQNGLISSKNFKKTKSPFGLKLEDKEVDEIMNLVDNDGDGFINFEEFVHLLLLAKNK
jgi:Ca2+-binding EF-hand superfamily protein